MQSGEGGKQCEEGLACAGTVRSGRRDCDRDNVLDLKYHSWRDAV